MRKHARPSDVDGILTAARARDDRRRDRRGPAARRQHPVDARAATPTRGTSSRPRWRSTSAAATTRPSAAYEWLRRMQHADGAWHAYYVGDDVKDPTLDTNVTCYVANGVWHHYLCTGDTAFLEEFWPIVERAIDFALDHQTETGEIAWHADDPDRRRAAHRLVEHLPQPALRDRDRRAARPRAPRLGALARRARHRDRAPPRALPRQGPLGDGLVLPDPRRRAARPRRPQRARRRALGHVRRRGPRRALRLGPAVGHRGRDVRARDGARRDRRRRPGARRCSRGCSSSATTTAATGPA